MKTILVDAINAFVIETENGFEIFEPMQKMPYEVFTLKHDHEKTSPEYYKKMLEHFNLTSEGVVYFEHNPEAVKSAQSVGIKTHFWDNEKRPLRELGIFLEQTT